MKTAEEIMTTDVITVSPDTEIAKAAKIMMEKRINGIPVVDSGKLIGILCQSDLIAQQKKFPIPSLFTFLDGYISLTSERHLEKEVQKIAAATVDQAMTPDPVTVSPGTSIEKIAGLMVDRNFHTLPVMAEGKLVGVVGKKDVLKLLIPESDR
jgi:CBS domain-containing protein